MMEEEDAHPPITIRRATKEDEKGIINLIGEEAFICRKRYGTVDILRLIEANFVSIVAIDNRYSGESACVGFACFHYIPTALPEFATSNNCFEIANRGLSSSQFDIQNSLWLNFFKVEALYKEYITEQIFNVVFVTFPRIDHILFPLDLILFPASFYPISPNFDKVNCDEHYSIFQCSRNSYSPKLSLRLGRVEDNDDLKDIVLQPNLTTFQFEGDFFMASTLQSQNSDQKVLVAVDDDIIVGLMYVSKCRRDITELNSIFDLDKYHNLIQNDTLNAIEIHLCYIFPEFLHRSIDFLEAVLSLFPQQYCFICIPYKTVEHPLLDWFEELEHRESHTSEFCLLVSSKQALFGKLNSVTGNKLMIDNVKLLLDFEMAEFALVAESLRSTDTIVCLQNSDEITIAYAIISDLEISQKYEMNENCQIASFHSNEIGRIIHFYVTPCYHSVSILLVKEACRCTGKALLFYELKSEQEQMDWLLERHMIILNPKRQIQHPTILQNHQIYPLFFCSQRLLSESKLKIRERIVVLGKSKATLHLINSLISIPYLQFNNIVLVITEIAEESSDMQTFLQVESGFVDVTELPFVLARKSITVIHDQLADFDRKAKTLTLSRTKLNFEYLILGYERGYKFPKTIGHSKLPTRGFINLNSSMQCYVDLHGSLTRKLNKLEENSQYIVYGSSFDAFSTINALITQYKIDPSKITLICPDGVEQIFAEKEIEIKFSQLISTIGITHYNFYCIEAFESAENGMILRVILSNEPAIQLQRQKLQEGLITTEEFELKQVKRVSLEIPCVLFINCHNRDLDIELLAAINKEALVFDSRLIIDPNFRTTDKTIFGVGPVAKFSRRYGVSKNMEELNSSELGKKLSYCLLAELGIEEYKQKANFVSVPEFTQPKLKKCLLPGSNILFQVRFPNCVPQNCHNLFTYSPNNSSNIIMDLFHGKIQYCSILVNKKTCVIESFTYVGEAEIEEYNFASIVGMSVCYFNDLIGRYNEGLITNLLDFLRQNWIFALYTSTFNSFRKTLSNDIKSIADLKHYVSGIVREVLAGERQSVLSTNFHGEISIKARQFMEKELLTFLKLNCESIPKVYYLPPTKE